MLYLSDLTLSLIERQKNQLKNKKLILNILILFMKLLDYIEKSLSGLLQPDYKETVLGTAEILKFLRYRMLVKWPDQKLQVEK